MEVYVVISTVTVMREGLAHESEQVACVCAEEFMAWAVVNAVGPEKARVAKYSGDVHVTAIGQNPFTFAFEGAQVPR